MKYHRVTATSALAGGLFVFAACASDNSAAPDASTDASATDSAVEARAEGGGDATTDGGRAGDAAEAGNVRDASEAGDARPIEAGEGGPADGGEAGGSLATFLAHFDQGAGQLPEGLWELADAGTPIVGLAPLARLVTVSADGGAQPFGAAGDGGAPINAMALGITTDATGNVYVGIGTLAAPDAGAIVPTPGVYRFGPGGGTGMLWSSAPNMNFPNGLTFVGNTLYVADSGGTIFAIDATGAASVWSSDALLAPDPAACGGLLPFPIGANGIAHDTNNFYVTNTNHGRIVKLAMAADGGAGATTSLVEDCAALAGADGLVLDTRDGSLLVAVNFQNKIVRIATGDGGTTVVTSGPPLDFPASVVIDSIDAGRRLLFTNFALASGDAGRPGLLALPIP